MKLKKIELRNYRQHHEMDAEFNGNLIAVVGRNGSGKSNFLGAIQFALTGEQPGFDKKDLLSWGESSGWVKLWFEHNGRECEVARRIESAGCTLKVGDETFNGVKKVQEALDEMLGSDKALFRQSVFVGQGNIVDVLSSASSDVKALQKLIGLDAEAYNRFLVEFLAAADRPRDLTEDIVRYSELVESQRASVVSMSEKASEIEAKIALFPDGDMAARIADLNSKATLARDAAAKHAEMVSANESLESFLSTHPDVEKADRVDTSFLHTRISEINAYRLECRNRLAQAAEVRKAREDVARLEAEAQSFDGLDAKVEEAKALRETISSKRAEKAQLEDLVSKAPNGNSCPLCGSTVDHDIRGELNRRVDGISCGIADLSSRLQALGDVDAKVRERNRVSASLEARRISLHSMGEVVPPPVDWDETTSAELSSLNAQVAEADGTNSRVERDRAELNMLRAAVDRATLAYDEAIRKIPGNPDPSILGRIADNIGNAVSELLKRQQELSGLKAEKARMDGMVQQAMEAVRQSEEAVARLRETQEANRIAGEKLAVVSDVKDWFNYRNGPRVVSQAIMSRLTDETNRYLEKFGSKFSVAAKEDGIGLRCVFNDGREMPDPPPDVSMLSGGQKVQLAVSFRFAMYSMFASKLGILSLDEPTAYLDDEAVSRFGDMLSVIREMAKNMDLQVLVSTHEQAIMGSFDQVVEIGA